MHKNAYVHFKMCLCHHFTDQNLRLWQTRGWEEGPSCTSRLLEGLSMPCSSTVAHWALLVFPNWGLSWPPGRLPDFPWQVQMCNRLPPLPRTAFSSPRDHPRDGKTPNALLYSSIGQSPSEQGFLFSSKGLIEPIGRYPTLTFHSFLLTYLGCSKQIPKSCAKFRKLSQFLISKGILGLRLPIQEY